MAGKRKEPKLGNVVKDATTGYTGVAVQFIEMASGTAQFCVQAKQTGKMPTDQYPSGINLDIHLLDFVEEGIADRVTTPTVGSTIELGWKVKDRVTGFEGTAMARHTFINGCIYYSVTPEMSKDQTEKATMTEAGFFEQSRLVKLDDGFKPHMVVPPPSAKSGRTPGGPATPMRRQT